MDKIFVVERDILLFAMRYAMNRMSYSSISVIENIKENIEKFNKNDIELFIKTINDAEETQMVCDIDFWNNFKSYLEQQLDIV